MRVNFYRNIVVVEDDVVQYPAQSRVNNELRNFLFMLTHLSYRDMEQLHTNAESAIYKYKYITDVILYAQVKTFIRKQS